MSKGHRAQHFVPTSYLRAWCDPSCAPKHEPFEPFVWVFERESRVGKPKAPHNIFKEAEFYTETNEAGARDLSLEHFLSHLETRFASLRRGVIDERQPMNASEHILLCFFCAAMHARTRAVRNHVRLEWERVLELGEKMEKWAKTATAAQLRSMSSLNTPQDGRNSMRLDDVRNVVRYPAQTALRNALTFEAKAYAKMDLALLTTDDPVGFITSDNPCSWMDPELARTPGGWQALGLGSRTIEVTLPLTPSTLLLLNRRGITGYQAATKGALGEANRITRFNADLAYVVRSNYTDDAWFFSGAQDYRSHG